MDNPLLSLLQTDDKPEDKILLATVSGISSGRLQLIFDGDTAPSQKRYQKLATYDSPAVGDRVLAVKMSGTYVVIGTLTDNGGGGGDEDIADPNTVYAGPASGPAAATATFRSLVEADLPVVPISKGGTGMSEISMTSTVSDILTAASGFTINEVFFAQWGKIAMLDLSFTPTTAKTTGLHTIGTLVAGKRPPCRAPLTWYNGVSCYISKYGAIMVYGAIQAVKQTVNSIFILA